MNNKNQKHEGTIDIINRLIEKCNNSVQYFGGKIQKASKDLEKIKYYKSRIEHLRNKE